MNSNVFINCILAIGCVFALYAIKTKSTTSDKIIETLISFYIVPSLWVIAYLTIPYMIMKVTTEKIMKRFITRRNDSQ